DYTVTEESRGSLTATILASHPAEKPVEIHLQKEAVHFTKIKIRIGVFGHEALSRQILKEIQEHIEQQERF
ncbi:DUF3568 family protein, partial [bacterium]|nr:DUF3568 family protein [bacterium]